MNLLITKMPKLCFYGDPNRYNYPDSIPKWIIDRYGNKRRYGYYIKIQEHKFKSLLRCEQIYYPDGLVEIIGLDELPKTAIDKMEKRPDGAYDCSVIRSELFD